MDNEHVICSPKLTTVTVAAVDAGGVSVTCLDHGRATLNSVSSTPPVSM